MEDLTLFSICTPHRTSHKWPVGEDGLVDYRDERITPREVFERFTTDYPMFTMIRSDVSKRLDQHNPVTNTSYTWIVLERFL